MKGIILLTIISFYFNNNNSVISKTIKSYNIFSDVSECLQECLKISKTNICYCDKQCKKYDDCCELFSVKCKNFFDEKIHKINDTNVNINSCCSQNPNSECFCDSNCSKFNDCCEDYQKCDAISIDKLKSATRKGMNRKNSEQINNYEQYKESVSSPFNAFIKIEMNYTED